MRRVRDFVIVGALVTTWLVLAQEPRLGLADHWGASWKSGWPVGYEFWVVTPADTLSGHHFSLAGLLIDVAVWLALIAVAWFFTWPRPQNVSSRARVSPT